MVKNPPANAGDLRLILGPGRSPGFPGGSAGKKSASHAGDLGSIPGLEETLEKGKGSPLQYCRLENSVGCAVHGVAKSRTRLSRLQFFWEDPTCHRANSACATQLLSLCSRARESQLLRPTCPRSRAPATREAITVRPQVGVLLAPCRD